MAVEFAVFRPFCEYLSDLKIEYRLILVQVIHLMFAWSSFLSWSLLILDIGLIGFLGMHAYRDGEWHNSDRIVMKHADIAF